jgi:cation transport ATPase
MARDEDEDEASPVRRVIQSLSIGLVLTAPALMGMILVVTGQKSAHLVSEALAWILGCSTVVVALPWVLLALLFAGSGDPPAYTVIFLAGAWAINASLWLRRFRFGSLLQIATLVAFTQCAVLAKML